jgi:hypothetical protein
MIKNKIDAREKALELATKFAIAKMEFNNNEYTEDVVIEPLKALLSGEFSNINFTTYHNNIIKNRS